MYKAWRIFRYEFRTNFRRRSYLFVTFGVPLILAGIVYALTSLAGSTFVSGGGVGGIVEGIMGEEEGAKAGAVGLVDLSGFFSPPAPGSEYEALIKLYATESEAQAALSAGAIRAFYVIGEGYLEDGQVSRYAEQFDLINAFGDTSTVRDFLMRQLVGDADPSLYFRLANPANLNKNIVALGEVEGGEAQGQPSMSEAAAFIVPYIFAVLIMMGTFFASGYLMVSVTQEKESRTVEILLSSAKPFPLLVGKVLASGALGLLQVVVYLATMWILAPRAATQITELAGLQVPTDLLVVAVIYFLGGYLMIGGVYAGVSAVAPKMQDAQQFVGFLVIPFVIPTVFIMQFISAPNDPLPVLLSIIPFTAPLGMVMREAATNVPLIEIVVSLVLLAVTAVGSIWFAGRLFRVNMLLAGQPPKLRDLIRLVREE